MRELPHAFSEYVEKVAHYRLLGAASYIDKYHPTESPIERLFLVAFFLVGEDSGGVIFDEPPGAMDQWFFVLKQAQVGAYRADFVIGLVEFPDAQRIVIECDGHDYHERTKEQASHDRKRDRYMQSAGYKVFRFTGSDLFRDAIACAEEVVMELFGIHHRASEKSDV